MVHVEPIKDWGVPQRDGLACSLFLLNFFLGENFDDFIG